MEREKNEETMRRMGSGGRKATNPQCRCGNMSDIVSHP